MLLKVLLERHVLPALQVRGENDCAGVEVNGTGRPDAYARYMLQAEASFVHRILHAAGDPLDHGFGTALRLGAHLGGANAFLGILEDAREDLGPAEVNTHNVFSFA